MINICICGHLKKAHKIQYWIDLGYKPMFDLNMYEKEACYHIEDEDILFIGTTIKSCVCSQFKIDNLKYLEEKYVNSLNRNKHTPITQ